VRSASSRGAGSTRSRCASARSFFSGREPTSFDATAAAFLANALHGPGRLAEEPGIRSMANLAAFCDRMWDACFPGKKPPV